ncbi:SDR family oxidoreductase [Haladaptatus sp. CMAA 1911]|uniref:SDR family oxidoreductase n=1 Tax=unclassified Haladaptatus TaxID=2622732 RepID=UPI003754536C
MNVQLKPVEEQVIVITGASSGIGLTTARMAAERGAQVVLAARDEDILRELTDEIAENGGESTYVVADVRDRDDVRKIASVTTEEHGGFDTWINGAGSFVYGRVDETPVEDMRDQFETNVWGLLYGSLEAADHLRDRGGAIVNIGSVASDRAIPLQGSYSASKHAVKGFTDSLRMELEKDDAPISVTLVKPASIDTPYPGHAKNHMDEGASLPPPIYAPETVARAILNAAKSPERDVFVGGGAKGLSLLGHYAPRLADTIMEKLFFRLQRRGNRTRARERNTIDGPVGRLEERGTEESHVSESSLYTEIAQRRSPSRRAVVGLTVLATVLYVLRAVRSRT